MSEELVMWLDLETTGLDANNCSIIEVGAILTNSNFEEVDTFQMVLGNSSTDYWEPFAYNMHEKSGLLQESNKAPEENNLKNCELQLIQFVRNHTEAKAILAGNSIHFDRRFIIRYMPYFNSILNYRMIDVSGMREALRIFKGIAGLDTQPTHRVLDDIRESIRLGKMLMERVG